MVEELPAETLKTLANTDRDGVIWFVDTIKFQGKLWLAPKWISSPVEGWQKPSRIICLSTLPHKKLPAKYPAHYALECPLPTAVIEGRSRCVEGQNFDVIELPDVIRRFDVE